MKVDQPLFIDHIEEKIENTIQTFYACIMQFFSRLFFFFCLPGIICHFPLHSEPIMVVTPCPTESYSDFSPWDLLNYETLSLDRILDFVEMIENTDNLEEIFTEQQIEEIEEFLVFLMRNGIREWDTYAKEQLEEDIAWMKGEPNNSSLAYEYEEEEPDYLMSTFNGYRDIHIVPAALNTKKPQIVLCKGKLKKVSKNIKRAIRRHKKEIIVAAVVVVIATVVIVATGGTATPEAVAGGGAAIKAAGNSKDKNDDDNKPKNPVNKPGEVYGRDDYEQIETQDYSYQNDSAKNPLLADGHYPQSEEISKIIIPTREIIQQKTYEIKEVLSESIPDGDFFSAQDEPSLLTAAVDKGRETGSFIAHEVCTAVTDQLSVISDVAGAFTEKLPEVIKNKTPFEKDSRESYQEMVEAGHEKIDRAFGTDQSHVHSTEGKEVRDKLTTGMLPPPGGFSNIGKNGKPLSQAYIHARNGGKNSGLIREYAGRSTKEIQKSINSLEKQILKHKDKIANPSKHYPDWNNFHPNRQKALVEKIWPEEIQKFKGQKEVMEGILCQME